MGAGLRGEWEKGSLCNVFARAKTSVLDSVGGNQDLLLSERLNVHMGRWPQPPAASSRNWIITSSNQPRMPAALCKAGLLGHHMVHTSGLSPESPVITTIPKCPRLDYCSILLNFGPYCQLGTGQRNANAYLTNPIGYLFPGSDLC